MLSQQLIKTALALTGKTMLDINEITTYENMNEEQGGYDTIIETSFSIEKFCYYLLSPEFLLEFSKKHRDKYQPVLINQTPDLQGHAGILGEHIFLYQNGEEKYLISTLSDVLY